MKKKIAVDIDDVLADSTESLRLVINKKFGVNLSADDYKIPGEYHGYYERIWENHGLHKLINFEEIRAEMAIDQSHVPAIKASKDGLIQLSKKYEIIFVTARYSEWIEATKVWLEQTFGNLHSELYFTHYDHGDAAKSKGLICQEIGAEWLIDDNLQHCNSAISEGVSAILFGEYGWNTGSDDHLIRAKNWDEVLSHLL